MKVTDLNGFVLTVTDLDEAINQADLFKGFAHTNKSYNDFDARQQAYWEDLHTKLVSIERKRNNTKIKHP